MTKIIDILQASIDDGDLARDEAQNMAVEMLDDLLDRLQGYHIKRNILGRRKSAPIGLYMWGGVGRGKSMLMDWFFDLVPQDQKKRVHFHAFMIDVHKRIGAWRKLDKTARRAHENHVRGAGDDPIAPTAKGIAREANILCFDEFHVTNIADAMILARLFGALWERGVVVVATSNREPEGLYKNGLNRPLFEPFIDLMQKHMLIHEFAGETDHRLRQLKKAPVYYSPLGAEADAGLQTAWRRLTGNTKPGPTVLSVQGREIVLNRTASGTVWTGFNRLCGEALGPADYLELAHNFQTVILENVPKMGKDKRNEAKRFTTLVDALYETKTKLIMSAEVQPEELYIAGTESFEFERTASRLFEMQSEAYLGAKRDWSNQE